MPDDTEDSGILRLRINYSGGIFPGAGSCLPRG